MNVNDNLMAKNLNIKELIDYQNGSIVSKTLIEKGKQRSQLFSWDKTARNLWESVEKIIKERNLN